MKKHTAKPSGISGVMVFKTSLQTPTEVKHLSRIFDNTRGIVDWSVDLDDWENILRIESIGITATEVKRILNDAGIHSQLLVSEKTFENLSTFNEPSTNGLTDPQI